jgi:hypothetical protein
MERQPLDIRVQDDQGGGEGWVIVGGVVTLWLVGKFGSQPLLRDWKYGPIKATEAACERGELEGPQCTPEVLDRRYDDANRFVENRSNDAGIGMVVLPVAFFGAAVVAGVFRGFNGERRRPKRPRAPRRDNEGPPSTGLIS